MVFGVSFFGLYPELCDQIFILHLQLHKNNQPVIVASSQQPRAAPAIRRPPQKRKRDQNSL
jgi:hypothetical protein